MKTFPQPLSAADEKEYIKRCRMGDQEARNQLVEKNMRLVAHIVKKYQGKEYCMDDLLSVGTIGLIKAVNTYHPDRGSRLATYAAKCVENAILSQMRLWRKINFPRDIPNVQDRLRWCRHHMGLMQKEVADLIGITRRLQSKT